MASAFDWADAFDDDGEKPIVMDRRLFGMLARQAVSPLAFAIRDEAGELALLMGLYPHPDGWFEGWFAVGPAMRRNLWAAVKAARTILDQVASDAAPVDVRCHVAPGSVAGHRLAPLFGLHETDMAGVIPDVTVWRRVWPAPEA